MRAKPFYVTYKVPNESRIYMKLLIVGGSYFLGKAFARLAVAEHEVYVLNRGNVPLYDDDIVMIKADRHIPSQLQAIRETHFDVVIDFCAYVKDDIKSFFENVSATFDQYIFISTCDVYRRGTGLLLGEDALLEERVFKGEAGEYICGKVALEKELKECAKDRGCHYTSIRPAFIYGPDNYAPRESMYFEWILSAGQVIHPQNASGEFYMTFVLDVARAILMLCGNDKAYDQAFNVCDMTPLSYDEFEDVLENVFELEFERIDVTVEDVYAKNIPLPFPLTIEESEHYDGQKLRNLGFEFTPIEVGMKITADYYRNS